MNLTFFLDTRRVTRYKMNVTCWVISNRPNRFAGINRSLKPVNCNYLDGNHAESFSRLVNKATAMSMTENVIIIGDKLLPRPEHVYKTLDLLDKGYAVVGLYLYGFFGFKKQLMREIGTFDERYIGGGYEDIDFTIRVIESNKAIYFSNEMPYFRETTSWNYSTTNKIHHDKWQHTDAFIKRLLPEIKHSYDLGSPISQPWLPCYPHSYVSDGIFLSSYLKPII